MSATLSFRRDGGPAERRKRWVMAEAGFLPRAGHDPVAEVSVFHRAGVIRFQNPSSTVSAMKSTQSTEMDWLSS